MTTITLYNTLTRSKEAFEPIDPKNVRMYACGPTVYDRAHIGNARPVAVFDVLFRLLARIYGDKAVTYVRNITDVDDKINAKSSETGRSIRDITDETIGWFREDMSALGALPPTREPRCTEYIARMIAMAERLIAGGFAYEAEGHVLFAVESHARYGALSGRSVAEMRAGARVEVAPYKKNPLDFVIWKPSTDTQPGWDSPWGRGRPGWHIECSAMAGDILGEVFDIHAGGIDLVFPHHENELAQSRCANGTELMARFWMHNEMVRVEGQKMAKSLGNFFTVRDLLAKGVPGEAIRYVLLSTHYRSPLDWTEKRVGEAMDFIRKLHVSARDAGPPSGVPSEPPPEILDALCDDLNTPLAIGALHGFAKDGNFPALRAGASFLGLFGEKLARRFRDMPQIILRECATEIRMYRKARAERDFTKVDEIRSKLSDMGIAIKDTPKGEEYEVGPKFLARTLESP